jgi:CxxC-x17-CxxC domain-containing protein
MEYSDRSLTCVDCGQQFVFSVGEQIFFIEKQFQHDPKRCKTCKAKRTNVRARVETRVTCAACGAPTIVPFVPREERPVLCRVCFYRQRVQQQCFEASVPAQAFEQVRAIEDRSQRSPLGGKLVV